MITAACLLTQGTLYSQSDSTSDSSLQRLDRVIVSATKSSRKISESTASVVVITRKEIQASAAKNVDDVLQYASGVQVKRSVGMGEGVPSDIVLRGIPGALAATRVLILVDGIPTNVAGTPFLIVNEIPLDAIQRIEIVKGPFSSLYGANALGGVINIITIQGDGKPSFTVSGETSYPFTILDNAKDNPDLWDDVNVETYWNASVQSSGKVGKYDYLVSAGARTIGNYFLNDSVLVRKVLPISFKDTTLMRSAEDDYGYTDYRFFVKGGYSFNDNTRLSLNLRYFNSSLGFGFTSTADNDPRITAGSKILIGPYLDFKPFGVVTATIGGFFRNVHGVYLDQYTDTAKVIQPAIFDVESGDFQIDGRFAAMLFKVNTVTVGFDQLWNTIEFSPMSHRKTREPFKGAESAEKTLTNTGLYIQDETDLFSFLHIVPALRFDNHSAYGTNFSPKIGIAADLHDKITIRSSFGKAYRAPSATELYMPEMYFSPVYLHSNPELKPEYTTSFDAGFELDIPYGFNVSCDYYYNKLSNLIVLGDISFDPVIRDVTRASHVNICDAWSWGFENELSWKQFKWISAKVNYAYTKSRNETYMQPLDLIPMHKTNLQLDFTKSFRNGLLSIALDEGYVGERTGINWRSGSKVNFGLGGVIELEPHYVTLNEYFRTDLTMSCTFATHFTVALSAQNLFNAAIEESFGTLSPGRFAVVKLKTAF
jgi:outer membrane cobalamin receptor